MRAEKDRVRDFHEGLFVELWLSATTKEQTRQEAHFLKKMLCLNCGGVHGRPGLQRRAALPATIRTRQSADQSGDKPGRLNIGCQDNLFRPLPSKSPDETPFHRAARLTQS